MITISNLDDFNIMQICECGQLFRFHKTENGYVIYSRDNKFEIKEENNKAYIFSKDDKTAENYFDLKTDYAKIKQELKAENSLVNEAIKFGGGIRILKQDPLETTISFIISANNNIPRIKKIIEFICKNHGKDMGGYFAFPTMSNLLKITENQFKEYGAGYRSSYLPKAIKTLEHFNFEKTAELETEKAREELMKIPGVGPKVADCILLFALNKKDVFPADVWIKKIYSENFNQPYSEDAKKVSKFFTDKYKEKSGIIQQYLYYYKRTLKI